LEIEMDETDEWLDMFDGEEDTPNGQEGTGKGDATKTQVEPTLSPVLPQPEADNPSMLSLDVLQQLASAPAGLPASFLKQAAGHLHKTQSIVDFATTVCIAVAEGKLKTSQSAELRKWAELMYTCIVANEPQQNNVQVNYVEQLIQLAGGGEAVKPEVVEVKQEIVAPRKKAQGE
jgi:hypothetical protein